MANNWLQSLFPANKKTAPAKAPKPKSESELAEEWRVAAEQGDAEAQFNLGLLHYEGQVIEQNYGEAARLYGLAAAQGHKTAQFNLGVLYDEGHGVR